MTTLPPDSDRAQGLASNRLFWRVINAEHHSLDTVGQDSTVVSGGCCSSPSQYAKPPQHVSACTLLQAITAVPAQQEASAASSLPAAPSSYAPQANGMPEGLSAGQAVHSSTLKEADASAAQEPHFQTLEQALSFFEKQDPEGFFGAPVTEDVAPNYFNVIKHPMSFQRMRQKLRALEYRTFAAFVEDFELVGNNAMRYNQKRSRVHRSAVNLLRHGKKHLNTVQLEATRAIHMLHPEGPVAAAQEEAAVSRAANAVALSTSTSNPNKLLPSLSMPHHSSKQLQRGVSGLDMSVPMALQDLQADYFSEEDPAYSSFSGMFAGLAAHGNTVAKWYWLLTRCLPCVLWQYIFSLQDSMDCMRGNSSADEVVPGCVLLDNHQYEVLHPYLPGTSLSFADTLLILQTPTWMTQIQSRKQCRSCSTSSIGLW